VPRCAGGRLDDQGLILTSYEDDEALFAAIMAGASGYVLKQIRGTDLVDAVRRVAAGQSLLDPVVTRRVLERIRNGTPMSVQKINPTSTHALEHVEAPGAMLTAAAAKALAVLRISTGFVFLWAFFDKTFGPGYATPSAKAWIHGGAGPDADAGHRGQDLGKRVRIKDPLDLGGD
jgi:hypothetical protein